MMALRCTVSADCREDSVREPRAWKDGTVVYLIVASPVVRIPRRRRTSWRDRL